MRRLAYLTAIAALLLATPQAASASASEHLPPFSQPVVDAADVIAPATEAQVGAELTDYQTRSGNQLAVAVVTTTGGQSIEDYAIDLARSWGIGQQGDDNGVLLVIAVDDRTVRVEVGRGLEGDLTDLQSGRILRERLVPLLQQGDIDEAVVQGTRAIRTDLGDTEVAALPPASGTTERDTGTPIRWLFPAAVLGIAVFTLIRRGNRGGHGDGRGRGSELGNGLVWGAALAALGGFGGHGGRGGSGGFGGGGGGGFGGGGASGDW